MFVVLAVLAGCAQPGGSPNGSEPVASRPLISLPSAETIPSDEGEPVTGEVPENILGAIMADAARQTGIGEERIDVIRAESVTWNDGSLGCPEPGMVYTQALVDGYHVVLDVDGEELDYRVDSGGGFRVCESPNRPSG
jgi:hypothetical protein